ncbi:MAG: methyl-accepting chemotaxis protein [Elusimicrobia bacterium]|nr:methyl-accepting chemotaxis protein [Elusimicrobiota bacterium]
MAPSVWRRQYYVNPQIQFRFALWLILIVAVESLLVSWGLLRLFHVASEWQRANLPLFFFKLLFFTIVPMVAINFLIAILLSHRIAGPLRRLQHAMEEICVGQSPSPVTLRSSDLLQDFAADFNLMLSVLQEKREGLRRTLGELRGTLEATRAHVPEVQQILTQLKKLEKDYGD